MNRLGYDRSAKDYQMTTKNQKAPVGQHRGFQQSTIAESAKGFNEMNTTPHILQIQQSNNNGYLQKGGQMINVIESSPLLIQYADIQRSQLSISEVSRRLNKQNIQCGYKQGVPMDNVTQQQLRNILYKTTLVISKSEGGYKNTAVSNWNTDFSSLVKAFSAPINGAKDGSYFIRCTGTQRNNADTSDTAQVLILDENTRMIEGGEILPSAPYPLWIGVVSQGLDKDAK